MWRRMALVLVGLVSAGSVVACPPLLDHRVRALDSQADLDLCGFAGKPILVVNTASQCGYTYQYAGLEHLHQQFSEQGLVVLGFPSNDFGRQEPGSEGEIKQFCRDIYGVQFTMLEKVEVRGSAAHPFFKALQAEGAVAPRWNFHKYLIDRDGRLAGQWPSAVEPEDSLIIQAVKKVL